MRVPDVADADGILRRVVQIPALPVAESPFGHGIVRRDADGDGDEHDPERERRREAARARRAPARKRKSTRASPRGRPRRAASGRGPGTSVVGQPGPTTSTSPAATGRRVARSTPAASANPKIASSTSPWMSGKSAGRRAQGVVEVAGTPSLNESRSGPKKSRSPQAGRRSRGRRRPARPRRPGDDADGERGQRRPTATATVGRSPRSEHQHGGDVLDGAVLQARAMPRRSRSDPSSVEGAAS